MLKLMQPSTRWPISVTQSTRAFPGTMDVWGLPGASVRARHADVGTLQYKL